MYLFIHEGLNHQIYDLRYVIRDLDVFNFYFSLAFPGCISILIMETKLFLVTFVLNCLLILFNFLQSM